jgi:hypothetical protein
MSVPTSTRYSPTTLLADETNPSISYGFLINSTDELQVDLLRNGSTTTLSLVGGDYTVDGVGSQGGGDIHLVGDYLTGDKLVAHVISPELQESRYEYMGAFPRSKVEGMGDYIVNICKRLLNLADMALRFPITEIGSAFTLPGASDRALKYLAFDANGLPIAADGDGAALGVLSGSTALAVLAAGSADIVDITILTPAGAKLEVLAGIEGYGYQKERHFILENQAGTLRVQNSIDDTYDTYAAGADVFDITCAPSGSVFDVNIDGSGLGSPRTINATYKITPIGLPGNISV